MTLFAGVYSRRQGVVVPQGVCDTIEKALSRHAGEQLARFRDDRCFLVKLDVGAFGERAVHQDSHGISMLVGDPLLAASEGRGGARSRSADLIALHESWCRSSPEVVRRARGVFAAVHYNRDSGMLLLVTDKLGVRPVYHYLGPDYVVFANALRVLEQVPEVPKVMELRAVTEIASIGFPLGARTAYEAIALLRSAEMLSIRGEHAAHTRYWRWDAIPVSDRPVAELAQEAYRHFMDGMALRSRSETTTVAFLSGGLDSRAIVTALRDRRLNVHTFNISHPGTQDAAFGAEYARRIDAMHTQVSVPRGATRRWAKIMAEAWASAPRRQDRPADRPALIWSGDGGSVGLGHVYLNESIVSRARAGNLGGAVDEMSTYWGGAIPARLLRSELSSALTDVVQTDWLEELSALHCPEVGRCLHILLMQNDQRRHLTEFYETIDLYRLEYHLPFFDSDFLAAVMQVPIDECLGHRFYMKWLRCFPDVVFSVPWQTYPGHEPCPLPVPPEHSKYQWGDAHGRDVREARRRDLLDAANEMFRDGNFPAPLFRRGYVRLASWLYRLRVRDLGYFIEAAKLYSDYWARSRGQYTISDVTRESPSGAP